MLRQAEMAPSSRGPARNESPCGRTFRPCPEAAIKRHAPRIIASSNRQSIAPTPYLALVQRHPGRNRNHHRARKRGA